MPKSVYNWLDGALLPVIAEEMTWYPQGLRNVLMEAISNCSEECLGKNGAIVTTLSGGLDSSFCLSRIKEWAGNASLFIQTFTIGESGSHPDIVYARLAVKALGLEDNHTEIIPNEKEITWAMRELAKIRPSEKITRGDAAVFLVLKRIAERNFTHFIAHDGIDELLGGYWAHREPRTKKNRKFAFQRLWAELIPKHLIPLEKSARHFGLQVLLPYLQKEVVEFISHIPVGMRTNRRMSKIPLRTIARKYLPKEIIQRPKKGFCDALNKVS
ncbi:MAG TPA: hypothetical protein DIT25_00965 [Candidatus Moranbacteria bacterium]|nr:hypothetical protein [Candidatus Moranbacteria bacterium]